MVIARALGALSPLDGVLASRCLPSVKKAEKESPTSPGPRRKVAWGERGQGRNAKKMSGSWDTVPCVRKAEEENPTSPGPRRKVARGRGGAGKKATLRTQFEFIVAIIRSL